MGYLRVSLFGQLSVVVYSGDSIFLYKLSTTEIGKSLIMYVRDLSWVDL